MKKHYNPEVLKMISETSYDEEFLVEQDRIRIVPREKLYEIVIAALLRRKGGATVIYDKELTAPPVEIRFFPHTDPETGKRTLRVDIIDLDKNIIEDKRDRRRET